MSHRAQQIIDAIAELVRSRVEASGVHVYTHRRLSLDPDEDELPGISIDYGEDRRAQTQSTTSINSVLTVECTAVVSEKDEYDCRTKLLDLRREIHRAIMLNHRLGLSFVVATTYGGADAPNLAAGGKNIDGELTTQWLVQYGTSIDDPGDN